MRNQKISNQERLLLTPLKTETALHPSEEWRRGLMTTVRRQYEIKTKAEMEVATMPYVTAATVKLMGALAVAAILAALLCFSIYLSFPAESSSTLAIDIPVDSFEHAITLVAQL